MYKYLFQGSSLVTLPLVALGIFVTVFVGVVVWALRGDRQRFDGTAALPLEQEDGGDHG